MFLCFRMKSLESDAVHAQAVIAKAQQLSRGPSQHASDSFSSVDMDFAGQYGVWGGGGGGGVQWHV